MFYFINSQGCPAFYYANSDLDFSLLNDWYAIPRAVFDPPVQSDTSYKADALPPSHHGWIFILIFGIKLVPIFVLCHSSFISYKGSLWAIRSFSGHFRDSLAFGHFGPLSILTNGITIMASVCLRKGSLFLVNESKYIVNSVRRASPLFFCFC